VRSLLFVCTANICRSAYAEVVANFRVGDRLAVSSAGTHGWTDHPIEAHMAAEAQTRGLEPTAFRSRRLTRPIIDSADVVLTAEAAHRTFVLQERPAAVRKAFSLGQLASALAEVPHDTPAEELLAAARRVRPTAHADEDVADPYGRGAEAAAAAAAHIDALLDRVLPRLTATPDPT
jgi:sulfate adenylyltransferase